ncbi:hypothetical protein [Tenacibaculum sp. SG-28]|uniref:hypothetical protein n=1 Tax=Tenacibaculum sp. SG-28 TaxID=754426 RepID=UPI000D436CF5|nr:hypothetical protein [Tenacibaculum sp. SG-28]PQJ19603.1 hypothetical protein BSU00_12410 [Tenacibaculum sp. SG-28]
MRDIFLVVVGIIFCNYYGFAQVKFISKLPKDLKEVSGIELDVKSGLLWMCNDSGNQPILYGVSTSGIIEREITIDAKNKDWEDITFDTKGNLYIADIGNNENKRKHLTIYKVSAKDLASKSKVFAAEIEFSYPDQRSFPPKKKHHFFDAESLFFFNEFLYVFTKSRVNKQYGKTTLYRIPAKAGKHKAVKLGSFETCNDNSSCWVTAADMSPDTSKVALLNHNTVYLFSNFSGDQFFNGKVKTYPLSHTSQKEGLVFKDDKTLYITDEKSHGKGGNLYEFTLDHMP